MMFDPSRFAKKSSGPTPAAKIVAWCKELLPDEIAAALRAKGDHVMINTREVQCGDPNCAPIDTVIALLFANGRRAMTGLPMEMKDVTRDEVARAMTELDEELRACHRDEAPPPQLHGAPPMSAAARTAYENVATAIGLAIQRLSQDDVAAVCAHAMDLLERVEESALRPPPRAVTAPPRAIDPKTKILAAAQKNDADAVARFLGEGIDVDYANSLGQTPLHIAVMWGNVEVATLLLDEGADPNPVNQLSGATPLHVLAASNKDASRRLQCAALLVDRGGDPLRLNADGHAPHQAVQVDGVVPPDAEALRDFLEAAAEKAAAGGL